jgi:hypothetical protein
MEATKEAVPAEKTPSDTEKPLEGWREQHAALVLAMMHKMVELKEKKLRATKKIVKKTERITEASERRKGKVVFRKCCIQKVKVYN